MEVSGDNERLYDMNNTNEKLPHDLVMEILSWLPIKHLSPLRCVSKTWRKLLTKDTQFAKLQYDRFLEINNNYPDPMILGLVCRNENDSDLMLATEFISCDKALSVQLPFYQPTNSYYLCGIHNGLLCVSRLDKKEVYIWNPLIDDHIIISCLPAPAIRFPGYCKSTGFGLPAPAIRFPGYCKSTGFGFGFDQDSNVYKVARFFCERNCDHFGKILDSWTQISVYTLGVDSMWRTVEVDIDRMCNLTDDIMPLVNGALHWHTDRPGSISYDLIVAFDLKEEVISEFLLPHGIEFQDIVELGGFLCATDRPGNSEVHIWVMKEYGVVSSWSKQYVIGKPEGDMYFCHLSTLRFTHNGEIILRKLSGDLVRYNPETNTVMDLKRSRFAVFLPYAYLGSIISPTAISRSDHHLLEEES
ncbi:hypothetical protein ACHQM5_009313 [Ranunculus cassubicifolius]